LKRSNYKPLYNDTLKALLYEIAPKEWVKREVQMKLPPKKWHACLWALIIFLFPICCWGNVSVNVPLGHWSYGAIDKLITLGLIRSAIYSTKPFTRFEMARLIKEAETTLNKISRKGNEHLQRTHIIRGIMARLEKEFCLDPRELEEDTGITCYIKPIEDIYLRYLHSEKDFSFENDKGQKYSEGSNWRVGFSTHGMLFNHLAFYINPEWRYSKDQFGEDDNDITILEGYAKAEWYNIEVEVGRDSMWWGPGQHGSLILTNNAKPFDLIKISNPKPILLPWFFRHLGLLKVVGFWSQLEDNRYVPRAEFIGLRVNLKPFPFLEVGASRTILLGGKGSRGAKGTTDLSASEWLKILSGRNIGGRLDTNQIAGFDFLLRFPWADRFLGIFNSIDLWGELYGEDEAASLPSKNGYVIGLRVGDIFLTGRTDLIIEYANNVIGGSPNLWYNHGVYRSGYRYEGRVMGHEMGSDARDLFLTLKHYIDPRIILELGYDYQKRGVQDPHPENRNRYDVSITWYQSDECFLGGGYRYESIDNMDNVEGHGRKNHVLWVSLNYSL